MTNNAKRIVTKAETAAERRRLSYLPLTEEQVEELGRECEALGMGALFQCAEFAASVQPYEEHLGALLQLHGIVQKLKAPAPASSRGVHTNVNDLELLLKVVRESESGKLLTDVAHGQAAALRRLRRLGLLDAAPTTLKGESPRCFPTTKGVKALYNMSTSIGKTQS